ncbi:MAG: vancomycin high temperature exclusion protein [Oscillospiraceae bacterium]
MRSTRLFKKWRRAAFTAAALFLLACLALLLVCTLAYRGVRQAGAPYLLYYEYTETLPAVNYLVVPGARVQNGQPSYMLANRLLRAYALYMQGISGTIVVSGEAAETAVMADYLVQRGVAQGDIWVDSYGIDLYHSLLRAGEAFPGQSMYLCIQEDYAPRAGYLIKMLGIQGRCINADTVIYRFTPTQKAREFFAAAKAFWQGRIWVNRPRYPAAAFPLVPLAEYNRGTA